MFANRVVRRGGGPVEQMVAPRFPIDRVEQVRTQERVEAPRIVRRDADQLVELEQVRVREIESAIAARAELRVQRDRCRTRGQDDARAGSRRDDAL